MGSSLSTSAPVSDQVALSTRSRADAADLRDTAAGGALGAALPEVSPGDTHEARILIVDDVVENAVLLQRLLVAEGYRHVHVTSCPRETTTLVCTRPYDLVLVALDLGDAAGIALVQRLAGLDVEGRVPVIGLATDPRHRLQALRAGAVDAFVHPVVLPELVARIGSTLEVRMWHRALRTRQGKLERDLAAAVEVCDALLPSLLPRCPGYGIAASSRSVDRTSGDVYDVVRRADGTLVLLVADATGHGFGPAITAMQLRGMLRMALRLGAPLPRIVDEANRQLTGDLPPDRFVTAFLGELDPTGHTVRYVAPGQGPLLHWRAATRTAEWRNASSPPLGVATGPFEPPPPVHLEPGDALIVATDGIFERTDASGRMFGEAGAAAVVREAGPEASAETLATLLQSGSDAFAGTVPASDDATVVVLKRLG